MSIEQRMAALTDKSGGLDSCWNWTGYLTNGYGRVVDANGRKAKPHRVAWELANRQPIPGGMHVLHRCDNPRCVNPAHLWLGTHDDNMADMVAKKRCHVKPGSDGKIAAQMRQRRAAKRALLNSMRGTGAA